MIDCVDNFQLHGFESAGIEVAKELEEAVRQVDDVVATPGAGSQTTTTTSPPEPRLGVSAPRRADAALRLLLRGFTPSAYTLWGELRWRGLDGQEPGSAAVFLETRGHVEAALQRLRTARAGENFERMDAEGIELDVLGALRFDEWTAAWTSYRMHGHEPELVEATSAPIDQNEVFLAERIVAMVNQHPDWSYDEWHAFLLTDTFLRSDLEAVFGGVEACATVLASVGLELQRLQLVEEPPANTIATRSFEQDARDFSTIAFALLPRDADGHSRETKIIDISCGLLFGKEAFPPLSVSAITDDDIREAATRLGEGISSDRGAEEMDHLLRVVLADERVSERERQVLELVAPFLGVPEEILAGRLAGIKEPDVGAARELLSNSGMVACNVCSEVLPEGSRYCGGCGNAIGIPPDSDGPEPTKSAAPPRGSPLSESNGPTSDEGPPDTSAHPNPDSRRGDDPKGGQAAEPEVDCVVCMSCRATWPLGSRHCGACAAPITSPSVVAITSIPEVPGSGANAPDPGDFLSPALRGNPRAGYAVEDWLHAHLVTEFGPDRVSQNVARFGRGQSDFVIRWSGAEFHIELKHVAQRNGSFHWSSLQVDLARQLPGAGHRYALVIAHPVTEGDYELFWCDDPLTTFRDVPKTTIYHYTHVVDHTDHEGPAGWDRAAPTVDLQQTQCSIKFVIRLHARCYEGMRSISHGENPIAPILDWRDGLLDS